MMKSAWSFSRHFIWLLILVAVPACNLLSTTSEQPVEQNTVSGAPVIRLASPTANATYLSAVEVNIQAAISNAGADIDRVEIVVDGAVIATYPQPNPSGAAAFSITQSWPITAVGSHTIGATAYRSDGTASAPAEVTITIMGQPDQSVPPTDQSTTESTPGGDTSLNTTDNNSAVPTVDAQPVENVPTEEPTATPEPTEKPKPTDEPKSKDPTVRIQKGLNVRSGPSIAFNPPIGSMAAGDETKLLAVNPAGDWYKIQYWNGEGWVFAQLVNVSGDVSNLPVDAGPPTPAPTAIPPTSAPQPTSPPAGNSNLVVKKLEVEPHPLVCNETAKVKVTVKNEGSEGTGSGGVIRVKDLLVSNGDERQRSDGVFPALAAGESYTTSIYLTVSVNYNELHKLQAKVDADNQVSESNEDDNKKSTEYVLQKGGC